MKAEGPLSASFFALVDYLERRAEAAPSADGIEGAQADADAITATWASEARLALVQLRHAPSLAFPTADVVDVRQDGDVPVVTSTFFGLTGSVSPLPEHLTEGWSQQEDAPGIHALFDRWHHRLLRLLYCSVRKYSPANAFRTGGTDAWSQRLLHWAPTTTALPPWRRLRAWRDLARRHRGREGLQRFLSDFLSQRATPPEVCIEPMTGGLMPLCAEQHLHLGVCNARLGEDAVVGTFLDAPASAFCVRLGPVDGATYAWLAQPKVAAQLCGIVELFTPQGIRADVVVELAPGAHPRWALSDARLGYATWLGVPSTVTVLALPRERNGQGQDSGEVDVAQGTAAFPPHEPFERWRDCAVRACA